MKNALLITAYCDNRFKVSILNETINRYKNHFDYICVYHHCRPDGFVAEVDSQIIDNDNPVRPISENSIVVMRDLSCDDLNFHVKEYRPEYGYAVAQQIKRGTEFLFNIGFDNVHIINYDSDVPDRIVNLTKKYNETGYNQLFLREEGYKNWQVSLLYLVLSKRPETCRVLSSISEEDFFSEREIGGPFAEGYFYEKFFDSAVFWHKNLTDEIKDKCVVDSQNVNCFVGKTVSDFDLPYDGGLGVILSVPERIGTIDSITRKSIIDNNVEKTNREFVGYFISNNTYLLVVGNFIEDVSFVHLNFCVNEFGRYRFHEINLNIQEEFSKSGCLNTINITKKRR